MLRSERGAIRPDGDVARDAHEAYNDGDGDGDDGGGGVGPLVAAFYEALLDCNGSSNSGGSNGGDPAAGGLTGLARLVARLVDLEVYSPERAAAAAAAAANSSGGSASTDHSPEPVEVVREIVADCQRKGAAALRMVLGDRLRMLGMTFRKRLTAKVALDGEAAASHAQRHAVVLIQLLGQWSDVLNDLYALGPSRVVFVTTIAPLHARVLEMTFECFAKFQEDKNLAAWQKKVLDHSISGGGGVGGGGGGGVGAFEAEMGLSLVNIDALDSLLTQLASMREIVVQYLSFLDRLLTNIAALETSPESTELLDSAAAETADGGVIVMARAATPTNPLVSEGSCQAWKELDATYVTLEFGYLSTALTVALREDGLLTAEAATVQLPQWVEDAAYLLPKVWERAVSLASSFALVAVAHKLIELLDPTMDSALYYTLFDKRLFVGCFQLQQLVRLTPGASNTLTPVMSSASFLADPEPGFDRNRDEPSDGNVGLGLGLGLGLLSPSKANTNNSSNNSAGDGSTSAAAAAAAAVAMSAPSSAAMAGVDLFANVLASSLSSRSSWFSGLGVTSVAAPGSPTASGTAAAAAAAAAAATSLAPVRSLNNLLRSAWLGAGLDDEDENEGQGSGTSSSSAQDSVMGGSSWNSQNTPTVARQRFPEAFAPCVVPREGSTSTEPVILSEADLAIYLNAVSATVAALEGLQIAVVGNGYLDCSDASFATVEKEFGRMLRYYLDAFHYEIDAVVVDSYFNQQLLPAIHRSLAVGSYDISGEEMESRLASGQLLHAVSSAIDPASQLYRAWRASLSSKAYSEVVLSLSSYVADYLAELLLWNDSGAQSPSVSTSSSSSSSLASGSVSSSSGNTPTHSKRHRFQLDDSTPQLFRRFSEWGAMLFHQEVSTMLKIFNEAIEDLCEESCRDRFARLSWMAKLLTLDQPMDIRRYNIPRALFREDEIRRVLAKRVDFLADAVAKVKINLTD